MKHSPSAIEISQSMRRLARNQAMVSGTWRGGALMECQSGMMFFNQYASLANVLREAMGVAKKQREFGDWKGFVDCVLDDTAKAQFSSWDLHDGDVWLAMASYLENGAKISISHNRSNGTFVAAVTGTSENKHNAGWTVSAFAPTVYDAVRLLLYKISVVLPDKWHDYESSDGAKWG